MTAGGHRCFYPVFLIALLPFFVLSSSSVATELNIESSIEADEEITLTLNQIIARIQQANRFLLQSQLNVQSSQYAQQSVQSDFDWKVRPVANLGLSKSETSTQKASGIAGEISKKTSYGVETTFSPSIAYVNEEETSAGVGVSLSVPLLRRFGKEYNYDSVYAADFAVHSSIRNVYLAEVDTVLDAVNLVYEIIRQRTFAGLYTLQQTRLQGHVATTRLLESTGLGTPIDTYRAQIRLKDVQDQLNVAGRRYQESLDRLKIMLAVPITANLKVEAPLSYSVTELNPDEAEKIALKNRLEIQQSEADCLEAKRKSMIAERQLLPDLNLVATYRKNTFLDGFTTSESFDEDYWSVGFTSNTDLARSAEKASYQQSLLAVRRSRLKQQEQLETILGEVKNQLNALEKEEKRIQLRQEQIVQAKGKMRLAEIKFSHGMGGNFDFIEAETELQNAKANLLQGKTAYIVGQYKLRAVLGTLITR